MNAEEPIRSVVENDSVSTQGTPLPEQPSIRLTSMPRQMNMTSLIYQWQPMGMRLVLNLPFISDDKSFLFYIRNGPFIPLPPVPINQTDYADTPYAVTKYYPFTVSTYGYNNTRPVFLASDKVGPYPDYDDKSDPPKPFVITLTHYDLPPPIATFAAAFRRWRGDMQYRIRVIAGFVTQGYIIITPLKNVFVPIGVYNMFKTQPTIQRQDASYKPSMMNSYALSDTSLYRHVEITMPYDYPAPFYDQYAWLSRRVIPGDNFYFDPNNNPNKNWQHTNPWLQVSSEPHGDNFIAMGVRGTLAATQPGAQIIFELEYRCMEGFQFADPFFPPSNMLNSTANQGTTHFHLPVIIPSREWACDGAGPVAPAKGTVEDMKKQEKKVLRRSVTEHHVKHYKHEATPEAKADQLLKRLTLNSAHPSSSLGTSSRNS